MDQTTLGARAQRENQPTVPPWRISSGRRKLSLKTIKGQLHGRRRPTSVFQRRLVHKGGCAGSWRWSEKIAIEATAGRRLDAEFDFEDKTWPPQGDGAHVESEGILGKSVAG